MGLLAKLHEVAKEIKYVEKQGDNKAQHYKYVQAVDVVRDVRAALLERGITVIPSAKSIDHIPYSSSGGKAAFLTTVHLSYEFIEIESGDAIDVPWIGVGADIEGDKGVYKAYTGALKYALLSLFLIPTTDDPERDSLSEQTLPEREASPRIPLDRAKKILAAATKVGMISGPNHQLHPALKALLASHGVDKIGLLNVDAAEEVEAFLEEGASV